MKIKEFVATNCYIRVVRRVSAYLLIIDGLVTGWMDLQNELGKILL
jgi:hypothetical protein